MSLSPPVWRYHQLNNSASKREEDLINAYEAEEEKIINVLSRKLEKVWITVICPANSTLLTTNGPIASISHQLREEKIELENVLEAESEAQVNRLNREISALRLAVAQNGTNGANGTGNNVASTSALADDLAEFRTRRRGSVAGSSSSPSTDIVLEALRRENEQLRGRVADMERDYVKLTRLNEIYREELIDHRRRVCSSIPLWLHVSQRFWSQMGMSVDNLIGIPTVEPVSHSRRRRSISNATSVSPTVGIIPAQIPRPIYSVPIPRPSSRIHRPMMDQLSEASTPLSHSPASSSESPFPLSPLPASFASVNTQITSPASSSLNSNPPLAMGTPRLTLTYPTNPPPSLSSSFGSPSAYASPRRELSSSPVQSFGRPDVVNRRASFDRRFGDSGSALTRGRSSRRESVERGARVAETGSLIRSRGGSLSGAGPSMFKLNENTTSHNT